MKKKGFTLAEMMIVLLIAGVVAALTIPILKRSIGNTDVPLFKSAYKVFESAVNDLVADISLYPSGQFDNTFCNNFANKVNTIGSINCSSNSFNGTPGTPNFITTNGMAWYGLENTTGFGDPENVFVDIDGPNKGSNQLGSDILTMQVYQSGKVGVINGSKEAAYLQN